MTRDEAAQAAIVSLLRAREVTPDKPFSLYEIGIALVPKGFSQDELIDALFSMKRQGILDLISGNRLQLLKSLPPA